MELRRRLYSDQVINFLPLVAPTNFDANAQNINIFNIFNSYANADKAYIYTFSDTVNTLTLLAGSGISYRYGYTRGGTDYIFDTLSVVNPFLSGDTKRYVIVNSTSATITATYPNGSLWAASGGKCIECYSSSNTYIKYVHHSSVTTIGNNAFSSCSGLTGSLTLPSSVTTIGAGAFSGCSGFTGSLTIPSSVTSIGTAAFNGCSGFTGSLTLPSSVTTIGDLAFINCSGLTGSLTLPSSVTTIGNNAFSGCSGFTGSLTIPSSVTSIGTAAFNGCSGLTGSLIILSSSITLGDNPFSLTKLILSAQIGNNWEIYDNILYKDTSRFSLVGATLNKTGSLIIPSSVTSIGTAAFRNCSGLTGSLTLPSSVTSIGVNAFNNCSGLTGSLTIPSSVATIGINAFFGCSGFTGSLTIPSSVTSIGVGAFLNCYSFTILDLIQWYTASYSTFNFSNNFTATSLNQSIINIQSGARTFNIGATNKARLLASFPTAETDANVRGITIV